MKLDSESEPSRPINAFMTKSNDSTVASNAFDLFLTVGASLSSVIFIVGSYCFFSWLPAGYAEAGNLCFLIGCLMFVILGLLVSVRFWKRLVAEEFHRNAKLWHVLLESLAVVAGGTIFSSGCLLYLPAFAFDFGYVIAAWLFALGSSMWVLAAFFRGLGLAEQWGHRNERDWRTMLGYQLACAALVCNLGGSVFFVVGSFMYQPGFATGCTRPEGQSPFLHLAKSCADILDDGTLNYFVGSVLFLLDAVLNLILLVIPFSASPSTHKDNGKLEAV